ncbi:MAG: methionyl-tRNA formyltransferase, partial [Desulfobacteraceae bacterium]
LEALARYHCHITLVITQPDRPRGRGKKMMPPPVKTAARRLGLEVIQPESMEEEQVQEKLKALKPDLFVVAAFGHKLSKELLAIPRLCPINIHASLLPRYRGSSPIQAALLNRDKETGVTTMVMDQGLDTGAMLLTAKTPIAGNETAATLHDRLAAMGADLIIETLDAIAADTIEPRPQNHDLASHAPILTKEDGRIDWRLEPDQIHALVRAMTPWPGTFTFLNTRRIKVFAVKNKEMETGLPPGTIISCDDQGIHVAAGKGSVTILELMGASGKRLTAGQFLQGNRLEPGDRLG